ncbi:hypothetical protein V0M98_37770 (plasmid) [Pseudomonas silesiensis]|uniref:hypothetical protein n=1 Tax=Pseudomonas silesiensis TaxID=1853130 RepID=UPI0030D53BC4
MSLDFIIYGSIAVLLSVVAWAFADQYREVHYGDPDFVSLVDQCYSLKIGSTDSGDLRKVKRTLANATLNHPGTRAPLAALGLGIGTPDYKASQIVAFFTNGMTRHQRAQVCHIIESDINATSGESRKAGQES